MAAPIRLVVRYGSGAAVARDAPALLARTLPLGAVKLLKGAVVEATIVLPNGSELPFAGAVGQSPRGLAVLRRTDDRDFERLVTDAAIGARGDPDPHDPEYELAVVARSGDALKVKNLALEIKRLDQDSKVVKARTGNRMYRLAFLRDTDFKIHLEVLKNPGISVDEVAWFCRQTASRTDALELVGRNADWTANVGVASALVKNAHTPMPIALRLVEKLPLGELKALARGGARPAIVEAARKKLGLA